jgi:hypothetical protein
MLLVLKPLALVFLAIKKGIGAKALTLSLLILPLIPITVLINCFPFAMRFPQKEFPLKLTTVLRNT